VLQLNKSQIQIQKTAREFATGEFDKDMARDLDRMAEFPKEIWKYAAELGFIGMHFPEKYGGGGMGMIENVLVAEEFCRKDATIGSSVMLSDVAADGLVRFGSDELRRQYIAEILEGRMRSGAAMTMPGGNDPGDAPGLTVTEAGDTWKINGKIEGLINGGEADIYCLLCKSGISDNGSDDISMFLVEADRPGIVCEKKHDTLGLRMTASSRVSFHNVEVPRTNLIGRKGRGLRQARQMLAEFQMLLSALALGTAQGALDRTLAHVKQREQFGRKIAQFQVNRHKLAAMATQIEQARFLTYQAAVCFDTKKPDPRLIAMAKLTAAKTAVQVAYEAIQLMGGYGFTTEYDVERFYRDAKALQIIGGNERELSDDIAEAVIGRIRK